jgi:hypothetical protein
MEEQWDAVDTQGPKPSSSLWIVLRGGPKDGRHIEVGSRLPREYRYPAPTPPKALLPKGHETAIYVMSGTRMGDGAFVYSYERTDVAD